MPTFARLILLLSLCSAPMILRAEDLPADLAPEQAIDRAIDARLTKENISAAPLTSDAGLIRRTMLDLVGRIPTAVEAKEYVAAQDSDKRVKLVDRLLDSPSYARHQANVFDTLLMYGTGGSLREYLTASFQERKPWDRMFREMIVGQEGDAEQKGAIKFVKARANDLDQLANDASVLFFGVNVSCARCHDHPLVHDWTQEHYFGMKSFFSRTYLNGDLLGEKAYGIVDYKTTKGESKTARLMFLTGKAVEEPTVPEPDEAARKVEKTQLEEWKKNKQPPPAPAFSRRAQLAEAALSPEGAPWFARSMVNLTWRRMFGRGLVHPTDQMHSASSPSHPELLDWLARDFIAHGYDLRRLIRGIALSNAYARSSRWESGTPPAEELFAAATVRPLSPHQYGTLLKQGAANPDDWKADLTPEQFTKKAEQIESAGRGFGDKFEVPGDDFQVSVDEALFLSNSDRVMRELLPDNDGTLVGKLKKTADVNDAIDLACWNVFGRPAEEEERQSLARFLQRREGRLNEGYQQMIWAMLTSGECRFNH